MSFKITKLTGNNIATNDANGIVSGADKFIKKIGFSINGREVYDCSHANHCTNIINLIDYTPSYTETIATNEFYYLDTYYIPNKNKYLTRQVQHGRNNANDGWTPRIFIENDNPCFNKGFADRKDLLANSRDVYVTIPLNRFSLFEACTDTLLPDSKFVLVIQFESDNNLIWRTGTDVCRIIITNFQLVIPQVVPVEPIVNHPKTLTFLNEYLTTSYITREKEGMFRITNSITNPRHVYVFFLENSKRDSQIANPFMYNTFKIDNDKTLKLCYLKVNEETYPTTRYVLHRDEIRIYQDVTRGVSVLNRYNFKELFPFIHFEISALKDESAKLSFHYQLSNESTKDYTVFAMVLHEKQVLI